MATQPMLKGLFDRPINTTRLGGNYLGSTPPGCIATDENGTCIDYDLCGPGYAMDIDGFCKPIFGGPTYSGGPPPGTYPPTSPSQTTTTTTTTGGPAYVTVDVNNSVNLTEQVVQPIADAINSAINANTQIINDQRAALEKAINSEIQESTDQITNGIRAASTNLGDEVKITSTALAASTAATVGTVAASINSEIDAVKNTITPILSSITGFIDKVNAEVQKINDTFVEPLLNLYNSTIGTIATLTAAIETDLKQGITGLLQLPLQLATQLASFDATLDRTVQQLGAVNKQTVTESIDYLGQKFPEPFSKALSQSLTGKSVGNSLSTTFADKVTLSSESLSQVSAEAIAGLGHLLKELLSITSETFKGSLNDMHANWGSVESMFIGLLDGGLSLLTTLTAMGALAGPLIEAAEEEAHTLIPITKLDPATVIEALRRGFIETDAALKELRTRGIDATRSQVLIDMSVFLADANQALDWWYRGIINDTDIIENLSAHGFKAIDIAALKEGSTNLPALSDLIRWMDFGIITVDQFRENAKAARYTQAAIEATLSTYQERETPQTLSTLDGLLSVTDAGWLNTVIHSPVPESIQTAARRAGMHPDLLRYVWLGHYQIPEINQFIQAYFRGLRTLTEVHQRMQVANIPQELWDDIIQVNHSLIPYRSIPSFVNNGFMTSEQADKELAAHGFDLAHRQIILKAVKPKVDPVNPTVVAAVHTLSQQNARTLWSEGAITDEQYTQVLIAHGYDTATAALQLKSDRVTEHIKEQKQEVADLTNQVLAGIVPLDVATIQLNTDGFTTSQISKFQLNIVKQQKVNTKIPSLPELNKFLKAQLITLDDYTNALIQSGWQDPWLTAFLGLVSSDGVVAGQEPA